MKHWLIGCIALTCAAAVADEPPAPGFDGQRHMRVSEVRDGMKGYGLSVFKGTRIERFDVEVVSVLKNFNPKFDVVVVTLKGANLEHTGGIAGMSGSPIYLKDEQGRQRLLGAFAYGWPMTKDPIGGVQPVEYMLRMPGPRGEIPAKTPDDGARGKRRWSLDESIPVPWKTGAPRGYPLEGWNTSKLNPMLGAAVDGTRLRPLATPLMMSGMPGKLLEQFEPMLRVHGIIPVQAGGAAADPARGAAAVPIEPGSSLAVPLMTGDVDMTAIGTCTEVLGDRVLGFGHAFFSEGDVALPMSSGYVHTVIANLVNSFKIGSATQIRGTVNADTVVGVSGKIGEIPSTIPIELRCTYDDGSFDQTYRFNLAQHHRFTPMLAAMAAGATVSSQRELPPHHTLDYDLKMEFANGETLRLKNRVVDTSAAELLFSIGGPIMAASENAFEPVKLKQITGEMKVLREAHEAQILSVSMPRSKFRQGETLKAFITFRPFRGAESILPLEFELPRDLPDGSYDFAVTDWQQHLMDEQMSRPFRFTAESAKEVFAVLRDFSGVRRDAVYMRLNRQPDGVAVGRTAMPRLPSSQRKILMGAGLSNTTPFVSSTSKVVATDHVMNGAAHFMITVDKEMKVEASRSVRNEPAVVTPPKPEDAKPKPAPKPDVPRPKDAEP